MALAGLGGFAVATAHRTARADPKVELATSTDLWYLVGARAGTSKWRGGTPLGIEYAYGMRSECYRVAPAALASQRV